jgi:hypothetical protein
MRKTAKRIALHRETLRSLNPEHLAAAAGDGTSHPTTGLSICILCQPTVNSCITHCGCPTQVQNCTALC